MKTLWKSMQKDMKSQHGKIKWEVGKWQKATGALDICHNGFHASERVIDAMGFVSLEVLAKVEVKGKSIKQDDKQCWSEMRIIEAYNWKKEDSTALSIYAAELCIKNFEKRFPNDKRPREAIEAAKAWLKCPCEKHQAAAESAARSAAESARSAAWSARSAAESAAESARSAAWSAESAAWSEVLDKCEAFIQKRIKTLEEYKTGGDTEAGHEYEF
jgi:hypothetical protein